MNVSVYAIPGIPRLDSPENILQVVCDLNKISPIEVMSNLKSRKRELVETRHISITLMYKILKMSNYKAGAFFNKDHATAIHARKTIANLRETNKEFRLKTDSLFNYNG